MKVFQLFLFLCLLISLNCKTGKEILTCAIVKLSNEVCEDIYQVILRKTRDDYINLLFNLQELNEALKACY